MFLTTKVTAVFREIVQSKIDLCDWDIHKTNIAEVGWGGGSMIFFFTAWDGSEGSIPGADVSLTQFFNPFSYVSYSKQMTLILLSFVQYVLCKHIYVYVHVCPFYVHRQVEARDQSQVLFLWNPAHHFKALSLTRTWTHKTGYAWWPTQSPKDFPVCLFSSRISVINHQAWSSMWLIGINLWPSWVNSKHVTRRAICSTYVWCFINHKIIW